MFWMDYYFKHTFMVVRGWILLTLVIGERQHEHNDQDGSLKLMVVIPNVAKSPPGQ